LGEAGWGGGGGDEELAAGEHDAGILSFRGVGSEARAAGGAPIY
jgi:hypothetical protein